jgi:hypothetical protein
LEIISSRDLVHKNLIIDFIFCTGVLKTGISDIGGSCWTTGIKN